MDVLVMLIPTIPVARPITPLSQQPAPRQEEGPPTGVPYRPRLSQT